MPNSLTDFLKDYWGLIAGILGTLLLLMYKTNKGDPLLKVVQKKGQDLADKINKARESEEERAAAEAARHEKAISDIKKKYDDVKENLNVIQVAEAERILELYKQDPQKLAEELSVLTGAKIIMPKD